MLVVGSGLETASGRRGVLVLQGHLFSVEEGGGGGLGAEPVVNEKLGESATVEGRTGRANCARQDDSTCMYGYGGQVTKFKIGRC